MNKYEIQPFFFPTTVAFIDDSADFLANLSLQLNPRLAFRLFKSPSAAMKALDGGETVPHPVQSFYSLYKRQQVGDLGFKHRMIDLGLESIHKTVHNKKRFEQISVAIVDYDMPMMNGLEFCRNIEKSAIRKILLTGKADERIAVNAFNDGLIDCFILKQADDAMLTLDRAIDRMQQLYFSDIERVLSDVLALGAHTFPGSHAFLRDPNFAECFSQIRNQLDIVEYYLSFRPDGMLMLSTAGTAYFLIVHTAAEWLYHYERTTNKKPSPELVEALLNGEPVQHRLEVNGCHMPAHQEWRACLHPAGILNSDDFYIYSVIKDPQEFNLEAILSYEGYLSRLDENVLSRF